MAAANVEVDAEDDDLGDTFNDRRRAHFENLLHEKWECSREGHTVCVPTDDGQHFRLANHNIQHWVNALCQGTATTANPPHYVFEDVAGGAVWNRDNGTHTVRAVSIAPSRGKPGPHHRPVGSSARSIDSTFDGRTGSRLFNLGSSTSTGSTSVTSGVPGPGYFGGKVIKWLGEKGLNGVQFTMIRTRAKSHISCLEKWEKHQLVLGVAERSKVFEMLGDALEMSRTCYSTTVNNYGYTIGRAVHHWLHAYHGVPEQPDLVFWLIQVQVSLIPILLTRISRVDPLASDLAYRTLASLTRVPLAVQGVEASATVIWLIARELAYAKCTFQHSWLGIWLLRIVEMSLRVRNLSPTEIRAIKELAVRREEQTVDYNAKQEDVWRPWEVALFAQCASQDAWFKGAVIGAHGLPSLVAALDSMLSAHLLVREIHWENVAITLRALAFLSEQEWVADAVDPAIIRSLLQVFRRSIPERWFCIRFWAADTMRNMVAFRPRLARVLLQEDAISAFEALTNPQLDAELSADPTQLEFRRHQIHPVPPVPPTPPTPPLPPTPRGSTSSPTITPDHSPNLRSSPLPMDELRAALSSSPAPASPSTPPPGLGDRRFSFKLTGRPSFKRPPSSAGRHERHASATIGSDITHPQPTPSRNNSASTSATLRVPHNSRRPPSLIPTPAQERLLEDYKAEATKRAMELSVYVSRWTEYSPDKLPTLESPPRLEVLGAGVGWLSSWEAEGWTHEREQ